MILHRLALLAILGLSVGACAPKSDNSAADSNAARQALLDNSIQQTINGIDQDQARTNAMIQAGANETMNGIPADSPITRAVTRDTAAAPSNGQ